MRRHLPLAVLATMLMLRPLPVAADSIPVIEGNITGIELCHQELCGAAFFAGDFVGHVNARPTHAAFLGAIRHQPLPEPYETSYITAGTWVIAIPFRSVSGVVLPGGTLTNNGDNTFAVELTMMITRGGRGTLTFAGILSHNSFPPTIIGTVSQ
jgi:hypothetical protein